MDAMQYLLRPFRGIAPFLFFAATSACVRPPLDTRAAGRWSYEVEAPAEGSRTLMVEATFERARTERLAIARESTPFVHNVEVWTGAGYRPVERHGQQWVEPSCMRSCKVRYRVDLGELAAACGDEVDCARRVGDATMSPALSWLVHPLPKHDVPVKVRVSTRAGGDFASGMEPSDDSGRNFAFRSYDLDEG